MGPGPGPGGLWVSLGGLNSLSFPLPGLPKAARVSHLKAVMCLSFYELVGASARDVVYLALPLHHMAGALLGVVGCLGIGERGRARGGSRGGPGGDLGADPPFPVPQGPPAC